MAEGLSKKQLKELKKLEKMQSRNLEQKNNSFKWVAISIVSAMFLVLFVGIVLVAKESKKPQTADGKALIAENGQVRMAGLSDSEATNSANKVAAVTLVEYADFQCPACKSYHPIITELLSSYPEDVRLVFKHFPLISIHPNAMDAAIAAEAAGRQGKFFEYIDKLYLVQQDWASLPNPTEKFEEYAVELELDIDKFKKDIKDPAIRELIEDHRSEGITNGVSGTPTFFVNGVRINSPASLEEFKKLIDAELTNDAPVEPENAIDDKAPVESTDNLQLNLQE